MGIYNLSEVEGIHIEWSIIHGTAFAANAASASGATMAATAADAYFDSLG